MFLSSVLDAGTECKPLTEACKVKTANIVALLTCCIAWMYAMFFLVAIDQPYLAGVNLLFVFCYGLTVLLSKVHFNKAAKVWFFVVLMVHLLLLTTYVFTSKTGFHYYYLLVPCGVFLFFNHQDHFTKFSLCLTSLALFFYCHQSTNTPYVELAPATEQTIFSSTIVIIMLEVFLIMSFFSSTVDKNQRELTEMANVDVLTGLNNRRTLLSYGNELIQYAKRYKKSLSAIILDIDHFKKINDAQGHQMGDAALVQVAGIIKNKVRSSDILARYGGEEFVVLLPETNLRGAHQLAESLRQEIENTLINLEEHNSIKCTISAGVSEFNIVGDNLQKLINRADGALYDAKGMGRNKVQLAL